MISDTQCSAHTIANPNEYDSSVACLHSSAHWDARCGCHRATPLPRSGRSCLWPPTANMLIQDTAKHDAPQWRTGDGLDLVLWLMGRVSSRRLRAWTARRLRRSGRRMLPRGRRARARFGVNPSFNRLNRVRLIPLQKTLHPRALRRRRSDNQFSALMRDSTCDGASSCRLVASLMTEQSNAWSVAQHISHIHAAVSTSGAA